MRRPRAVVAEGGEIAGADAFGHGFDHPFTEGLHPRLDRHPVLCHAGAAHERPQVVREAPGADDQHAFVAQRRERAAHRHLAGRRQARHQRDLHHRDGRLGQHQHQRNPRAMVERLARVEHGGRLLLQPGHDIAVDQRADALGQHGRTRRGIFQCVQLRREAAEIMPRLLLRACRHGGAARHPVRRHHHDGTRRQRRHVSPERRQGRADRTGISRQHRRPMGEIEHGKHVKFPELGATILRHPRTTRLHGFGECHQEN